MNNKEIFKNEYLCKWVKNKEYQIVYDLWLTYYYLTEKYDQGVCSGRDQYGIAYPTNTTERRMINEYERRMYKDILYRKRKWEEKNNTIISNEDWKAPKKTFNRMTFRGLENEYNAMIKERKIDCETRTL